MVLDPADRDIIRDMLQLQNESNLNPVPPNSTESLGVLILKSHGIFPQARWYWIGVAALIGYIFLFNLLLTLALQYFDPFGKSQTILSKEGTVERKASTTGEFIELLPRGKSSSEITEGQRSLLLSERGGRTDEANGKRKRGMVLPFNHFPLLSMRSDMQ